MNARATAVIATRLIGLVLTLLGGAALLGQLVPFIAFMKWIDWRPANILDNLSGSAQSGLSAPVFVLGPTGVVLGWYLLFRGRRVHGWLTAGLDNECAKCGYNLRGVTADKCPECGASVVR